MKKILFITGSMGKGGAERVISLLSKYYIKKGWKVSIAMLLHNKIEYEIQRDINIVNLSSKYGIKRGFFGVIKNTRTYIKEYQPDVIACFMAQNILLTALAIKNLKIPFIVSERIDPSQVKRNVLFKYFLNRIYEKSSLVIFQTKRAQNYFNEKIRKNSCIIGNPISVTTTKSSKGKHIIVSVGRMTKQKNQEMLIRVFNKIHDKYPEYIMQIYGDGPLKKQLEHQITDLGLSNCVFLPGVSDNIHSDISNAEMFVLPSNFEGLSNALMEAMLMGLPCISTNCSGSDEIITNKENGLLVPIGDEEKMYEAIEKMILNPELREKISNNSINSMEQYKEENIIRVWDSTIEKVLNDI